MRNFGVTLRVLVTVLIFSGTSVATAGASKSSRLEVPCATQLAKGAVRLCTVSSPLITFHSSERRVPKPGTDFISQSTAEPADDVGYGTTSLWVASTGSGYAIFDASAGYQVSPTITTFTESGKKLATITPGLAYSLYSVLVHPPTGGIVIALDEKSHPAQGLTPASQSFTFTAWSANSGKKLWTTPNFSGQGNDDFRETSDGLYATAYFHDQYASVINLSTGSIRNFPILEGADFEGTVGNFIDVLTCIDNPVGGDDFERLISPTSGAIMSSFQAGVDDCDGSGPAPGRTLDLGQVDVVLNGNLGNAGLFEQTSYGTQSGISPNGSTLLVNGATSLGDCCVLSAYSLPSMRRLWTRTEMVSMKGDNGGILVGLLTNAKTNVQSFVGIDDQTGSVVWQQPTTGSSGELQVCAISMSETMIVANDQLIGLNLKTGHQNWYAKNDNVTCGNMLTGGAAYYFDTGVTIRQILTP